VFSPFEGFSSDPYRDYSEPWMDGHHQVLRGASWITPDRMKRPGYRNFYQKHRSDIFCGFRTCAM
jgi:EgtB-related family protein